MKLQPEEETALSHAALLLRYAAESPKEVPENLVRPISDALKAKEEAAWSPEVATKFYTAYSSLCNLLKPVTIDTISVMGSTIPRRTANLYRVILIILLLTAVVLGFFATAITSMSDDIKAFIKQGETAASDSEKAISGIKLDIDKLVRDGESAMELSLDETRIPLETIVKIAELRTRLRDMWYASDMLKERADGIAQITILDGIPDYISGDWSRLPKLADGLDNIKNFYNWRRKADSALQKVFILKSIYQALLPLLFGAIGACTYVLRLISEEIHDSTFSSTSPVIHSVRVFLGALAGVAVGLGGIVTNSSELSSAALAFVAGYAVEPVFSTLDGIAEKFRRTA
jgi:hypothetical protein